MSLPLSGWKNVKNSGNKKCNCGSWKDHWINSKGDWPTYCSVKNCYERAEDGAHVRNEKVMGEKIVPMCKKHNNPDNTSSFELKSLELLADATCNR